ncbi:uncharacterized protein [Henckelia pumila]|uniref:uncharacterized protein n=1 Tax=Henckelia pumila TaxID=405737 RepID=UPI003C6DFB96
MSNISKLEFAALDISGKNYLSWILDAEIHLDAMGIGNTIKDENNESPQNRAKAMIFLRHYLHDGLKIEYLTIKDPRLDLWNNLKERYSHQKTVILSKARYDWMHLRLQNFKSVSEYNSALFRISSQLKLCGEKITDDDLLKKTYSTFHASNVLLQQQYREKGFKKYSELISCLLVAEQNNELLMKNHEIHPTGANPFPEVNGQCMMKRGNKIRPNLVVVVVMVMNVAVDVAVSVVKDAFIRIIVGMKSHVTIVIAIKRIQITKNGVMTKERKLKVIKIISQINQKMCAIDVE